MKAMILKSLLVGCVALGLWASPAKALDDDKDYDKSLTVTGCLQHGGEHDEFLLTDADGKRYGIRGSEKQLSAHVNHKVSITGKVKKGAHDKEVADIRVSELTMVSSSCD